MENELYHYGVLGMKWGVRRFQNKDGSWTSAGKKRYGETDSGNDNSKQKPNNKVVTPKENNKATPKAGNKAAPKTSNKVGSKSKKAVSPTKKESYSKLTPEQRKQKRSELADKLFANSSFSDSMKYNRATYDLAAEYIVDYGYDKQSALSLAKQKARLTTGALFVKDYIHYNF